MQRAAVCLHAMTDFSFQDSRQDLSVRVSGAGQQVRDIFHFISTFRLTA